MSLQGFVSREMDPTDSAVVTTKPRASSALASRCRNDLSSSTMRSERSVGIVMRGSETANSASVMSPPCLAAILPLQPTIKNRNRSHQTAEESGNRSKSSRRQRTAIIAPRAGPPRF